MKYQIVLLLPFSILLVHRTLFQDDLSARAYQKKHYATFPGLEVWPLERTTAWRGLSVVFPINGS